MQTLAQAVVLCMGVFSAPAVEDEVQQHESAVLLHRDGAVVPGPGIVRGEGEDMQAVYPATRRLHVSADTLGMACIHAGDDHGLPEADLLGDGRVAAFRRGIVRVPLHIGAGPGQHHTALGDPLWRQLVACSHLPQTLDKTNRVRYRLEGGTAHAADGPDGVISRWADS